MESREGEGSRQVKGERRKEGEGKGWERLWERSRSSEKGGEKEGGPICSLLEPAVGRGPEQGPKPPGLAGDALLLTPCASAAPASEPDG